jgi:hypothetical protein
MGDMKEIFVDVRGTPMNLTRSDAQIRCGGWRRSWRAKRRGRGGPRNEGSDPFVIFLYIINIQTPPPPVALASRCEQGEKQRNDDGRPPPPPKPAGGSGGGANVTLLFDKRLLAAAFDLGEGEGVKLHAAAELGEVVARRLADVGRDGVVVVADGEVVGADGGFEGVEAVLEVAAGDVAGDEAAGGVEGFLGEVA